MSSEPRAPPAMSTLSRSVWDRAKSSAAVISRNEVPDRNAANAGRPRRRALRLSSGAASAPDELLARARSASEGVGCRRRRAASHCERRRPCRGRTTDGRRCAMRFAAGALPRRGSSIGPSTKSSFWAWELGVASRSTAERARRAPTARWHRARSGRRGGRAGCRPAALPAGAICDQMSNSQRSRRSATCSGATYKRRGRQQAEGRSFEKTVAKVTNAIHGSLPRRAQEYATQVQCGRVTESRFHGLSRRRSTAESSVFAQFGRTTPSNSDILRRWPERS